MKAEVKVEYLEMEDPTFEAGTTKKARARLSNPTTKQFTYTVELYLGVPKEATSGVGTVTIPAKSFIDVEFTIVMPNWEAGFPVLLDVRYAGALLAHYEATENVVIVISPAIVVGPITWV